MSHSSIVLGFIASLIELADAELQNFVADWLVSSANQSIVDQCPERVRGELWADAVTWSGGTLSVEQLEFIYEMVLRVTKQKKECILKKDVD